VILSVLAPVRDEGPALRGHLHACLRAVSDLDVELVLLDNRSIDGCCHGLPREILIVRTERFESPIRLWRLGKSLARGQSSLWLPRILSLSPARFRALVVSALNHARGEESSQPFPRLRRVRFGATRRGPALLTSREGTRLDRIESVTVVGRLLFMFAAHTLKFFISLNVNEISEQKSDPGEGPPIQPRIEPIPPAKGTRVPSLAEPVASLLSVILTAHNEGAEVLRTVESVQASTRVNYEIIVVDDGSTDGSCLGLEERGVRVVRHPERVGVAYSRDAGSRAALGDVLAYLDAHQRIERGCLDRCAELAAVHEAIICPPCRPLNRPYPVGYGASFTLCPERGFFSSRSRFDRPRQEITRISALRSPGYLIPRSVYPRVAWSTALRGWGATDYCLALKAFFTDVDVLMANTAATRHLFRKRIPYDTSWDGVWRNHALIARICFDDRTWHEYWLPEIFQQNLSEPTLVELSSATILAERDVFHATKVRPDREFWRGLLRIPEPGRVR
jgi:glycosyltransferase involved in cell wall biosynthesis